MEGNQTFIFSGKDEFRDDLITVAKKKDEILDLEKTLAAMNTQELSSNSFKQLATKRFYLEKDIDLFYLKCIGTLTAYYNQRKIRNAFIATGLKEDFNAIKFAGFFCGTFFGLFLAFLYNL